jgi:hypothetical protein
MSNTLQISVTMQRPVEHIHYPWQCVYATMVTAFSIWSASELYGEDTALKLSVIIGRHNQSASKPTTNYGGVRT